MRRFLKSIEVAPIVGNRARGRLRAGRIVLQCALGPAGITTAKREGDGATPRAELAIRRIWRRADRGPRTPSGAPTQVIGLQDGWCDAAGDRRYNRLIRKPYSASHEDMWRADGLYDLVVELGWNDRPAVAGRGSAIFMHAARPGFTPTAGCVAIEPRALRRVARMIGPKTTVRIGLGPVKARR